MRILIAFSFLVSPALAYATLSASGCKAKIQADHLARTGQSLDNGANNNLIDICQGIIDEITADAQVQSGIPVSTTGNSTAQTGSTTSTGTVK